MLDSGKCSTCKRPQGWAWGLAQHSPVVVCWNCSTDLDPVHLDPVAEAPLSDDSGQREAAGVAKRIEHFKQSTTYRAWDSFRRLWEEDPDTQFAELLVQKQIVDEHLNDLFTEPADRKKFLTWRKKFDSVPFHRRNCACGLERQWAKVFKGRQDRITAVCSSCNSCSGLGKLMCSFGDHASPLFEHRQNFILPLTTDSGAVIDVIVYGRDLVASLRTSDVAWETCHPLMSEKIMTLLGEADKIYMKFEGDLYSCPGTEFACVMLCIVPGSPLLLIDLREEQGMKLFCQITAHPRQKVTWAFRHPMRWLAKVATDVVCNGVLDLQLFYAEVIEKEPNFAVTAKHLLSTHIQPTADWANHREGRAALPFPLEQQNLERLAGSLQALAGVHARMQTRYGEVLGHGEKLTARMVSEERRSADDFFLNALSEQVAYMKRNQDRQQWNEAASNAQHVLRLCDASLAALASYIEDCRLQANAVLHHDKWSWVHHRTPGNVMQSTEPEHPAEIQIVILNDGVTQHHSVTKSTLETVVSKILKSQPLFCLCSLENKLYKMKNLDKLWNDACRWKVQHMHEPFVLTVKRDPFLSSSSTP